MSEPQPKQSNLDIGKRIRAIRASLGMDLSQFSKRIVPPASATAVSRWERGINKPNNERLKSIAELGNISINYLLTGETILPDNINSKIITNLSEDDFNKWSTETGIEHEINKPDNDKTWELWTIATGYNKKQIEDKIEEIKSSHYSDKLKNKNLNETISFAVSHMDNYIFNDDTDIGVLNSVEKNLREISNNVENAYIDKSKMDTLNKNSNIKIFQGNQQTDGTLIYDDMDNEIYLKIENILHDAITKIRNLKYEENNKLN